MEHQKILIIDDDSRNIFALVATLKYKGYACVTASSAEEGMSLLRSDRSIKVVLMDMMMPDMDGYEAISEMRNDESLATLPVIAVTAQAMTGDREKCLRAGASNYVSKPINVDALDTLLKKYLN